MSQAERTLQAQIVALAQAGNTAGLNALVQAQVRAGRAASLARVVASISTMAVNLANVDPQNSAALMAVAVEIASDPAVSAADITLETTVGSAANTVVATVQTSNPQAAAQVQTAVNTRGSSTMQTAFVTPSSGGQDQTPGAQQTGQVQSAAQTPIAQTPTVDSPTSPETPEIEVPENPRDVASPSA